MLNGESSMVNAVLTESAFSFGDCGIAEWFAIQENELDPATFTSGVADHHFVVKPDWISIYI